MLLSKSINYLVDFLIGFYALVDGDKFKGYPNEMIDEKSNAASLKHMARFILNSLNNPNRDELVRLAGLLHKRCEIVHDLFGKERSIVDNNEWIDNWVDMLESKIRNGFSAEDVVSLEFHAHSLGSKVVRREDLVVVRNLNDAFLGMQHFFTVMYNYIKDNQNVIVEVQNEWDTCKAYLKKIVLDGNKIVEKFNSILNEIKKGIENIDYTQEIVNLFGKLLKEEAILSQTFYNFIKEFLLKEDSALKIYLNKLIDSQKRLLILTRVPNNQDYENILNEMISIINNKVTNLKKFLIETENFINRT